MIFFIYVGLAEFALPHLTSAALSLLGYPFLCAFIFERSVGKYMVGTVAVGGDGKPLGRLRLLARYLLATALLGLGHLAVLGRERTAIHDRLTDSVVIIAAKDESGEYPPDVKEDAELDQWLSETPEGDPRFVALSIAAGPQGDPRRRIACIATAAEDLEERTWLNADPGSPGWPWLSVQSAREALDYVNELLAAGYVLLSWGGARSDLPALARASGWDGFCRQLTRDHIDLQFHIACTSGQLIELADVVPAMELEGGWAAEESPIESWLDGEPDAAQHPLTRARLVLAAARHAEWREEISWESGGDQLATQRLDYWLSTNDALGQPKPWDYSNSAQFARDQVLAWVNDRRSHAD